MKSTYCKALFKVRNIITTSLAARSQQSWIKYNCKQMWWMRISRLSFMDRILWRGFDLMGVPCLEERKLLVFFFNVKCWMLNADFWMGQHWNLHLSAEHVIYVWLQWSGSVTGFQLDGKMICYRHRNEWKLNEIIRKYSSRERAINNNPSKKGLLSMRI